MKLTGILSLAIIILILFFIVGITARLSDKYEWYFYVTAASASLTATIIYNLFIHNTIKTLKAEF